MTWMLGVEFGPRIGDWYYICCEQDLYPIEDEIELQWVKEQLEEEDGLHPRVFRTKEEALSDLRA